MSPETLEGIYFKFASKAASAVNYDGSEIPQIFQPENESRDLEEKFSV